MKIIQQIDKFLNWLLAPIIKLLTPIRLFLFPEKYLEHVQAYKDALKMNATEYYFRDTKYKMNKKLNKYISLYSLFSNTVFVVCSSQVIAYLIIGDLYDLNHNITWFILIFVEDVIAAIILRFFIASCEEV